jgi:hypothetical protein
MWRKVVLLQSKTPAVLAAEVTAFLLGITNSGNGHVPNGGDRTNDDRGDSGQLEYQSVQRERLHQPHRLSWLTVLVQ